MGRWFRLQIPPFPHWNLLGGKSALPKRTRYHAEWAVFSRTLVQMQPKCDNFNSRYVKAGQVSEFAVRHDPLWSGSQC